MEVVQHRPQTHAGNREKTRESIFFGATLTFTRTTVECPVRVRNISSGGMMVDCTAPVVIGDEVVADIRHLGKVIGKVAWSVAPRMGISFDHEIDPTRARLKI